MAILKGFLGNSKINRPYLKKVAFFDMVKSAPQTEEHAVTRV